MTGKRIEKSWTWTLRSAHKALWPLISDTERMNEALKLPRYRLRESVDEDGLRRRYGEYDDGGTPVRWEEIPFEWSKDHWWRWDRLYETGPLERTSGTLVLEPDKRGAGTTATYTLVAEPRNLAGAALARTGHLAEAGKAFERLLKLADAHARKPHGDFYANLAATRTGRKRSKQNAYTVPAEVSAEDRPAAQQLLDWLSAAFESDLRDIRPKRVARALGIGMGEAHRVLVTGAEIGALNRRFRLICPTCRATVREADTPRDLPRVTHCPRCAAAVEPDYAQNIEVVFSPHSAIQEPSPLVHCASGPQVSPRIILQQIVEPHERRDLPATLNAGAYVIRTLDGSIRLDFQAEGGKGALIRAGVDWIQVPEIGETVVFENHGEATMTLVVERADWPAEATSLSEWLTYQRCRDTTPSDSLELEPPQNAGALTLVIVSARGEDEMAACLKLARGHGGAVIEDTGAGILLAFSRPVAAKTAINAALQLLPAARIGADHGPLSLLPGALYAGEVRDKVADLAGLAQEGVPNRSPAFMAALEG